MIGKLETMQDDLAYLAAYFPWLSEHFTSTPKLNSVDARGYHQYFDQLSDSTKKKLCDVYRLDFALFDYNCDIL